MFDWATIRPILQPGHPVADGLYVLLIKPEQLAQLDRPSLLHQASFALDNGARLEEERDGRLVLSNDGEFVRAFRRPSRALIEEMAKPRFPGGSKLTIGWVVNSAIMFALAWEDDHAEVLPIGGLGRAAWVPLDDYLSKLRGVPMKAPPPRVAFG